MLEVFLAGVADVDHVSILTRAKNSGTEREFFVSTELMTSQFKFI